MYPLSIALAVLLTALLGIVYPSLLMGVGAVSAIVLLLLLWRYTRHKGYAPQGKSHKTLEKLRKKQKKHAYHKHQHINDQIAYIREYWGYTKEQERIAERFITQRAYSELYNKLTASLIPQIITLIDNCNARERKGCKREVSKRIRDLTNMMKAALQKKKTQRHDDFETTLEVYDTLIKELAE